MIYRFFFISIVAAVVLSSCSNVEGNKEAKHRSVASANKLGIVDTDIQSNGEDLLGEMPTYSTLVAGKSQKIERAFENAPPMIPHMTEGFFPITKDNNICLSCHMPDKAAKVKAVPLPVSHFTDYRPAVVQKNGKYVVAADEGEVVSKNLGNKLSATRFNCSQCHVPQAIVTVDIKNTFEAVFRDSKTKEKSNLDINISEGVK